MASSSTDVLAKRPRTEINVRTTLLSQSKQTKTALMQTLVSLKTQGLLDVDVTRGDLKKAAEHHANQDTPYGKVVQKVEINAPPKTSPAPVGSTTLTLYAPIFIFSSLLNSSAP